MSFVLIRSHCPVKVILEEHERQLFAGSLSRGGFLWSGIRFTCFTFLRPSQAGVSLGSGGRCWLFSPCCSVHTCASRTGGCQAHMAGLSWEVLGYAHQIPKTV